MTLELTGVSGLVTTTPAFELTAVSGLVPPTTFELTGVTGLALLTSETYLTALPFDVVTLPSGIWTQTAGPTVELLANTFRAPALPDGAAYRFTSGGDVAHVTVYPHTVFIRRSGIEVALFVSDHHGPYPADVGSIDGGHAGTSYAGTTGTDGGTATSTFTGTTSGGSSTL